MRIAVVVALGVAIVAAVRHLDARSLGTALAGASLGLIAVAVVLNLVVRTAVRARRTQLLLGGRLGFADVVRLNLAGYAAAALLPGPAEEVVRSAQLVKRNGMSLRELARYQIADKALSIASIGVVALALVPPVLAVPIGAAGIAVLAFARRDLLAPLGWLVISNLLGLAITALCIAAVGGEPTTIGCIQLLVATSLASLIPMPGQIGTLESAFVVTAVHQGLDPSAALAASVLYHLVQVAPLALAGLPHLCRISWEAGSWARA